MIKNVETLNPKNRSTMSLQSVSRWPLDRILLEFTQIDQFLKSENLSKILKICRQKCPKIVMKNVVKFDQKYVMKMSKI